MEMDKNPSFEKKINTEKNDLSIFKKFINKKANNSFVKRKIKNANNNLFLTQNKSQKNNLEKSNSNKNKRNINEIINLLNPANYDDIFDGYAVTRKKYSFEELIKKVGQKEKKECLEKNKLFKNPYPLIKFLSNRKLYNNSSSLLSDLLNNDTSKLSKEQLIIINKKDENKKNNNISMYTKYLSNSYNYYNKQNFLLYPKNKIKKINKISKTLSLKRNIRLYDFLNVKNPVRNSTTNNSKDKNFMIYNNKHNLPLFNRYIKNKAILTNDSFNNKGLINQKSKIINKTEKTIYLNTELFRITNKSNNMNFSYNTSINNEENESSKIKSISNTIFNKKNKYGNLNKIFFNNNI